MPPALMKFTFPSKYFKKMKKGKVLMKINLKNDKKDLPISVGKCLLKISNADTRPTIINFFLVSLPLILKRSMLTKYEHVMELMTKLHFY